MQIITTFHISSYQSWFIILELKLFFQYEIIWKPQLFSNKEDFIKVCVIFYFHKTNIVRSVFLTFCGMLTCCSRFLYHHNQGWDTYTATKQYIILHYSYEYLTLILCLTSLKCVTPTVQRIIVLYVHYLLNYLHRKKVNPNLLSLQIQIFLRANKFWMKENRIFHWILMLKILMSASTTQKK